MMTKKIQSENNKRNREIQKKKVDDKDKEQDILYYLSCSGSVFLFNSLSLLPSFTP